MREQEGAEVAFKLATKKVQALSVKGRSIRAGPIFDGDGLVWCDVWIQFSFLRKSCADVRILIFQCLNASCNEISEQLGIRMGVALLISRPNPNIGSQSTSSARSVSSNETSDTHRLQW